LQTSINAKTATRGLPRLVEVVVVKDSRLELLDKIVETLRNNRSLFDGEHDYFSKGYRVAVDDAISVIRDFAGIEPMEESTI